MARARAYGALRIGTRGALLSGMTETYKTATATTIGPINSAFDALRAAAATLNSSDIAAAREKFYRLIDCTDELRYTDTIGADEWDERTAYYYQSYRAFNRALTCAPGHRSHWISEIA